MSDILFLLDLMLRPGVLEEHHQKTVRMAFAEISNLRALLGAARPICLRWEMRGLGPNLPGEKPTDADLLNALCDALRALDGES